MGVVLVIVLMALNIVLGYALAVFLGHDGSMHGAAAAPAPAAPPPTDAAPPASAAAAEPAVADHDSGAVADLAADEGPSEAEMAREFTELAAAAEAPTAESAADAS